MPPFPQKKKTVEITFIEEHVVVIRGERWHRHDHELQDIKKLLQTIIKNQNKMSAQVDALKAKIATQSDALDSIGTNVTGIAADVKSLKDKLANLPDGATAAEIAELSGLVDGVSSKIDNIAVTTASLDAETDPNA